jgi:hypothetical protein
MIGQTSPRVFISYSHDSREHEDRVLALADRLREDGIDTVIDQYHTAPSVGWPMWTDREIHQADFVALVCTETYLRRVEGREEPSKGRGVLWEAQLIYTHLYVADSPVQRFIPILLEEGVPSWIPWPLRGLAFYEISATEGYEGFYRHVTGQPRHEKPELRKLKALPPIPAQSYPASPGFRFEGKRPTNLHLRNRLQMLQRVRLDWIDGVLRQSLYKVARIELGLEASLDAVEQPLNVIVRVPDRPRIPVPVGASLISVFDSYGGALLILGTPGTGKTTLLLELTQELLQRAEQDESHPMPVVFNLSSWALRRHSLSRWLVAELNERNDVPKRLARRWVEGERILPLLDGLDEVAADHRQACVEAINEFRRDHGLLQIAVCSRIADYESLGTKLRLRNAVVVQPLTRVQVREYVDRVGEPLEALRAALRDDPAFWDFLETPLLLWVAMLASRNAPLEISEENTFEQRRRQVFAKFVDSMLNRRSPETPYTQQQTLTGLSWLASSLNRRQQTVFYLEDLHEKWLPTRPQRWLSKAGIVVASGLSGGIIGAITYALILALILPMIYGPNFRLSMEWNPRGPSIVMKAGLVAALKLGWGMGLPLGVFLGLIGAFMKTRPPEKVRFRWAGLASRLPRALGVGFAIGLGIGLCFALFYFVQSLLPYVARQLGPAGFTLSVRDWMVGGLEIGLPLGLFVGLLRLLSSEAVEVRRRPNQGTRDSIKVALAALPVGALMGWLFWVLNGGLSVGFDMRVLGETIFGLIFALVLGLFGGGLFALRHFVLRLVLWIKRSAPLNYVRFLDYAVDRLFLRKVGGGYIFVHRMLLEYFAALARGGMR